MSSGPLLVVAPHPDDEVLGAGATIAAAVAAGREVHVVLMTSGEAQREPGIQLGPAEHDRSRALASQRRAEALAAACALGLSAARVHFLGLPDLGLFASFFAPPFVSPWTGQAVAVGEAEGGLRQVIAQVGPGEILVSHPSDRHRDHMAAYCLVDEVVRQLGLAARIRCYLIHARGPRPAGAHGDPAHMARKRQALMAYASQHRAFDELFQRALVEDDSALLLPAPERLAAAGRMITLSGDGPVLEVGGEGGELTVRVAAAAPAMTLYAHNLGVLPAGAAPLLATARREPLRLAAEWQTSGGTGLVVARGVYPLVDLTPAGVDPELA